MHKLLICLAIITFSSVLANSVLARGEKSEIRFLVYLSLQIPWVRYLFVYMTRKNERDEEKSLM